MQEARSTTPNEQGLADPAYDTKGRTMSESRKSNHSNALTVSFVAPVLIFVASGATWLLFTQQQTPLPQIVDPPPVLTPPPVTRESPQEFFDSQIQPLLHENHQANLQAVDRSLQRIEEAFSGYLRGIRPFSEDVTSIGTRFGVLTRMPLNWWYADSRIQRFVQEKFEKHIFGEDQFNADISSALKDFRDEVYANRRNLLASVKVAVSESDFPDMPVPEYENYSKQINTVLTEFSSNRATDSVYHGIATIIASEVAFTASAQIITRALSTIGSTAAISAVASGGTTAAGAATGAGSGSVGGPVGTAIGLGVGLVVGVLVDWWMTENFKVKLADDLNQYLTKLRDGIVKGVDGQPGLRASLQQICIDCNRAESMTMNRSLLGSAQ